MKRKIHNFKIQQKVLFYLLGFIFVILCIFYLAQVVFLKDFYMFIKEQGVTKATEQIKASLQQAMTMMKYRKSQARRISVFIPMGSETVMNRITLRQSRGTSEHVESAAAA